MKGKQITIGENQKQRVFYNNLSIYLELINNYLSKKIKTGKLGKHIKIFGGYAFKSSQYQKEGIPVIRISDFQNEKIDLSGVRCYEEKSEYDKYQLLEGDILIAMTGGTIGKLGIVQEGLGKLYLNQRVGKFHILKPEEFFNRYVYWLARGVQERVKSFGYGGAQPNISGKQIEELEFPIPDKKTQEKIINFLEGLRDNCLDNQKNFDSKTEKKILKLQDLGENLFQVLENSKDNKTLLTKLKQAILSEAVQGKLVPQNPSDESAVELLKKIKKEKEKLIKEGKIRKGKDLPAISDDEIPYELPKGWVWCRLGDVCEYGSSEKIESKNISPETWILDLEDIEKTTSKLLIKKRFKDYRSKSTKNIFSKGDVLYGKLRPYLDKVIIADENGVCTTEIIPLRIYKNLIINKYFRYFLKSPDFLDYVNSLTYGVKMPRLGTTDGKMALFPLPPLVEQRRIVEKVDALMKFCDELELRIKENREGSERLMGAVLGEVFGNG